MQLFNIKYTSLTFLLYTTILSFYPYHTKAFDFIPYNSINTQNQAQAMDIFLKPKTPLQLYPEIGSKKIQTIIFPKTEKASVLPAKTVNTSARTDQYLLNIFCTEATKTYVKAVSGSGVFLTDPRETQGVILTNAHVARHLLDKKKTCVGRTGSPAVTTHKLILRYIPSFWLNNNNQYVIGDPDQSSTGEFDFALIEATPIKTTKNTTTLYDVFKSTLNLQLNDYGNNNFIGNTQIYSYPAQQTLSKNIYNPLFQKIDTVRVDQVYASPTYNEPESLLDTVGSSFVDHGSSGGMVLSVGTKNNLIGLSSILIKDGKPQTVRVVTLRHIFSILEKELLKINNAQTDSFLLLIQNQLSKKEADTTISSILKNQKLTSVLEKNTRDTLIRLGIIKQ